MRRLQEAKTLLPTSGHRAKVLATQSLAGTLAPRALGTGNRDGNSGFRHGGSWESKEQEGDKEDRKQRSAELGSWRLLSLLPQPGTLLRYPCCGPADQACQSHTGWHPEITAGGHT